MRHAVLDSSIEIVSDGLQLWLDASQLRSYSGSGSTWSDLTTNGNNITLTGTTFSTEKGGSILFGNVSTDYGYNSSVSNMDFTNFTIESWIKRNSTNTGDVIFSISKSTYLNVIFHAGNAFNEWNGQIINTSGTAYAYAAGSNTSSTNWTHWLQTYNGTDVKMYINSTLTKTQTLSQTVYTGGTVTLNIGRNASTTGGFFDGYMSIIRAYNTALTDTQVLQNYNAEKSRFGL